VHEFGIMEPLLREAVAAAGGEKIRALKVRVGPLSGVVVDALRFAFESMAPGTAAEGARLDVVETRPEFRCPDCGCLYETPVGAYRCPGCGSARGELAAGNEMELESIEVQ
jgi:hydrogenase nickel incorporation protein HypA/HybF